MSKMSCKQMLKVFWSTHYHTAFHRLLIMVKGLVPPGKGFHILPWIHKAKGRVRLAKQHLLTCCTVATFPSPVRRCNGVTVTQWAVSADLVSTDIQYGHAIVHVCPWLEPCCVCLKQAPPGHAQLRLIQVDVSWTQT